MLALRPIVDAVEAVNRLMEGIPTPSIAQTDEYELTAAWGEVELTVSLDPPFTAWQVAIGVDDEMEPILDGPILWSVGEPLPAPVVRAFEVLKAEEAEYNAAVADLLTSDEYDLA